MKKILCLALVLVMAIALCSCGNKEETSEQGMTISIMGKPTIPLNKDTDTERWLEEKYDVNLEIYSVTASYYEKLGTMLASGEVPDVMFINEPSSWQPLVDQDFIAEIPVEKIKKYAPRHYAAVEEVDSRIWSICSYKGKNFAMPKMMGEETDTVMLWRKDWLEKCGITKLPVTLDEYEDAYIKIRNNDPDGNGKKDTYGMTGCGGATEKQFDIIFGAFGTMPGQWFVKDDIVENGTVSENAKKALELLHRWYDLELIDPEMITDTQAELLSKFISGRTASFNTKIGNIISSTTTGINNKNNFEGTNPGKVWEEDTAYGNLPTGANGERGGWLWGPRANFAVLGSHLENDEEKLAKILGMLDDICYDEEVATRVVWGEKGVHYDYSDPSVGAESGLQYLPPYNADSNARAEEGIGGFFSLFAPESNWADVKITRKYMDPFLLSENDKYYNNGNYHDELMRPHLESSTLYQLELDRIKTTAYSDFITGKRDLSEWDEFVAEYMKKGGEQLQKEAQKFYDENMK